MHLTKSKCWYSNNCLHFLKCTVKFGHTALFYLSPTLMFNKPKACLLKLPFVLCNSGTKKYRWSLRFRSHLSLTNLLQDSSALLFKDLLASATLFSYTLVLILEIFNVFYNFFVLNLIIFYPPFWNVGQPTQGNNKKVFFGEIKVYRTWVTN
jgi:hypothetical protein